MSDETNTATERHPLLRIEELEKKVAALEQRPYATSSDDNGSSSGLSDVEATKIRWVISKYFPHDVDEQAPAVKPRDQPAQDASARQARQETGTLRTDSGTW
jgi:hypothetical protein